MSSMGLGRRLLAMTGRMSIYRGSVVTDPGSIRAIEDDHLDHWRLGRIKLLTGDDKSTWFWLLPARARDVLPAGRAGDHDRASPRALAAAAATQLMLRCFGNMLRTSTRAIALGPQKIGGLTWWCLIDQRLSIWTPLIGPTVALLFVLGKNPPPFSTPTCSEWGPRGCSRRRCCSRRGRGSAGSTRP